MGALFYFPEDMKETVSGSSCGEPDGTQHVLQVLEGNGRLIIRVQLNGSEKSVDLLLDGAQALAFAEGVNGVIRRIRPLLDAAAKEKN